MELEEFEEKLLFSTMRILVETDLGTSVGTGFIISTPIDGTDKSGVFLISNKHVFVDPKFKIMLSLTKSRPDIRKPDIGKFIEMEQTDFTVGYTPHPNTDIDLACINISNLLDPELGYYMRYFTQSNFHDLKSSNLTVGADVFFIGYPDNRFDNVHNVPIFRKGCIASSPRLNFLGKEQFLIDAQVFGGSSGSPVFVAINGEYKIVGVVTQTMIKNKKIQPVGLLENLGIAQEIGLGLVLRINLIKELIDVAVTKLTL